MLITLSNQPQTFIFTQKQIVVCLDNEGELVEVSSESYSVILYHVCEDSNHHLDLEQTNIRWCQGSKMPCQKCDYYEYGMLPKFRCATLHYCHCL